jgi:hypothetical protein
MILQDLRAEIPAFLEILGLTEEPLGLIYSPVEPENAISPQQAILPTVEMEQEGAVNWEATFAGFSCVIGNIWRARKTKKAAYFSQPRFGCLGGAFYLGFLKPQFEQIVHYVSTGIPGILEGECYLESPEVTRRFFETIDPRPAPEPFAVIKPLSLFTPQENPEVVIFFARPESICGLNQLATFVTNDFEAVGPLGPALPQDRRNHLHRPLGDVRAHGHPLAGVLPHQTGLGHSAQKDRAEPEDLERGISSGQWPVM